MSDVSRRSFRRGVVAVILASFAFAFGADSRTNDVVGYSDLLKRYQPADREVLRMRNDTARGRLWVLTVGSVYVYDTTARTLLVRIPLPQWSVADFEYALPPDIALDRRGAAFVSNNVEPRLLEIHAASFEMKEHRLRLVSRPQSETGFASLQFAQDGTLRAVGATGRLVFRIDLHHGSAEELRAAPEPALQRTSH